MDWVSTLSGMGQIMLGLESYKIKTVYNYIFTQSLGPLDLGQSNIIHFFFLQINNKLFLFIIIQDRNSNLV